MSLQQITVKSVNVHRDNTRIHTMLHEDTEVHILLIQEPWFNTIATLRSDTDPLGTEQRGAPINNMWDLHLPTHNPSDTCKAITYTCKSCLPSANLSNVTTHPLANPNTVILDIKDDHNITMWVINFYHAVPRMEHHALHFLSYELCALTPTIMIGDFNTHSLCWSMPRSTPSCWATRLENWVDDNGLLLLNPAQEPTWFGSKPTDHPSVLDLAFANECTMFNAQLSDIQISHEESLGSDHATLTFHIYPLDSLALIPPLAPTGYRVDEEQKVAWMGEFARALPYVPPGTSTGNVPSDYGSMTAQGVTVHDRLAAFDHAIQHSSAATLKPRRTPHNRGAPW
jgi:hypothetical protein